MYFAALWNLWSNNKVEKKSEAEELKSRQKRQNQNIGDESQEPHVVTASQYVLETDDLLYRIASNCSTRCLDQFLRDATFKNIQFANFSQHHGRRDAQKFFTMQLSQVHHYVSLSTRT